MPLDTDGGQAFRDSFCAVCLESMANETVPAHRKLFAWELSTGHVEVGTEWAHFHCAVERSDRNWILDASRPGNHKSETCESPGEA